MSEICLFCGCRLAEQPQPIPPEHIVAQVFVGRDWLVTYDVCGACNHDFGAQVDRVGATRLFVSFREEAGLPIARNQQLPGIAFGDDGRQIRIRMLTGGASVGLPQVVEDDKGFEIHGSSQEEVERIAAGIDRGRRKRGESPIHWSGVQDLSDVGTVIVPDEAKQLEALSTLLPRLAAKVAVEYIGLRYGAAVALHPDLDPLRNHARTGNGASLLGMMRPLYPDRIIILPRTNYWHMFRETPGQYITYPQQLELTLDEDGQPRPPPSDAHTLSQLEHRVQVWRDPDGLHFTWIMFSCFQLYLYLPESLPIHRPSVDGWDFSRKREYSHRP
ncbi:MAG TPA: hypothetical protein VII06_29935 [Chloroflexota bacterium]|jgi:hypothetical protein